MSKVAETLAPSPIKGVGFDLNGTLVDKHTVNGKKVREKALNSALWQLIDDGYKILGNDGYELDPRNPEVKREKNEGTDSCLKRLFKETYGKKKEVKINGHRKTCEEFVEKGLQYFDEYYEKYLIEFRKETEGARETLQYLKKYRGWSR